MCRIDTTKKRMPTLPAMKTRLPGKMPKKPETALLVSVRTAHEAKTALLAGAGLIDCKEPGQGPLGRCGVETWRAIGAVVQQKAPLSAALGEWHEWADMPDDQIQATLKNLAGFEYAKLGPAGSADQKQAFLAVFERLRRLAPPGLRWICVVYADPDRARSLDRHELLALALRSQCAGLLMDTFDKTKANPWGKDLFAFCRHVKTNKMPLALAGGLTVGKIKTLKEIKPAWFAVRGAACRGGGRTEEVSFRQVRRLVRVVS